MGILSGKVAIVTGAGRGIGKGIAIALAEAGADVGLVARSKEQLDAVADEIAAFGGRALPFSCDVTERASVTAVTVAVEEQLGAVSILVNNAGVDHPYGFAGEVDPDIWWHAQNVHVLGALYFIHACLLAMQKSGYGRIVNMASAAAILVGPGTSAYCVAKSTLVRLTEHIDLEQRAAGVRAFTGHPGTIVTEMMRDTLKDPDALKYAPHIIDYLTRFINTDTSHEAARLGAQMVEIGAGLRDEVAGRYVNFEEEIRPKRFGPRPGMSDAD